MKELPFLICNLVLLLLLLTDLSRLSSEGICLAFVRCHGYSHHSKLGTLGETHGCYLYSLCVVWKLSPGEAERWEGCTACL